MPIRSVAVKFIGTFPFPLPSGHQDSSFLTLGFDMGKSSARSAPARWLVPSPHPPTYRAVTMVSSDQWVVPRLESMSRRICQSGGALRPARPRPMASRPIVALTWSTSAPSWLPCWSGWKPGSMGSAPAGARSPMLMPART